jgi:ubiquinone/menaquinone biosynthesis C-methylase UbiE
MTHLDYPNASALDARVRLHVECSTNRYGWQRWVMDHVLPHLKGQVLEVGTGPAYLWTENAMRIPGDVYLLLSDCSSGMLVDARSRVNQVEISADWLECNVMNLPFGQSTFDTVIANHLLFLIEEPSQGVAEIARLLHPGGVLCATTNHCDHLRGLMTLFLELSPDHFGHLDQSELRQRRERFDFVSGADHLLPHFEDVKLLTYEDGLEIDRAEILGAWMDYWADPALTGGQREQILNQISTHIAQEGVLRIRKNSGMFIARKNS